MNTVTDSIPPGSIAPDSDQPHTIVLQPRGLDKASSQAFQATLQQALHCVTDTVIVDLIWVDAIEPEGMAALKAGIEMAICLGRSLSFQAISPTVRAELESKQTNQRTDSLGDWTDACCQDFKSFLTNRALRRREAADSTTAKGSLAKVAALKAKFVNPKICFRVAA